MTKKEAIRKRVEPDIDPADETYLNSAQVRSRYGDVTLNALFRWINKPDSEFPKPVYIGERRFWKLSELVAFERRCVTLSPRLLKRERACQTQ